MTEEHAMEMDSNGQGSQVKTRRRAPKACLSCRARKVRCDVSQRGRPCMNCYLDSEDCVVTSRATRSRRKRGPLRNVPPPSHPSYSLLERHGCARHSHDALIDPELTSRTTARTTAASARPSRNGTSCSHAPPHSVNGSDSGTRSAQDRVSRGPILNDGPRSFTEPRNPMPSTALFSGSHTNSFTPSQTSSASSNTLTYSFYPFLVVSNLQNIPPQDVNFLEQQGCLHVPTRDLIQEFLQQYFLHVHPMLPLTNEGDFWDIFENGATSSGSNERVSLLLFQAILFSACQFVSGDVINALGYPSASAARAALYRRSKLLYDLESESSPLAIAQAALLLSFWGPSSARKPNTSWLSLAIQHAKSAEAHHYAAMPTFSIYTHPLQRQKQRVLKKVWWCCVIRDRTLGLLMRRPIQISRDHFEFSSNRVLDSADLEDEFRRSRVYNSDTKRNLAEILAKTIELYVLLTDILMVAFPLDDVPGWGRDKRHHDADRIRECKSSLREWHNLAAIRFPLSKSPNNATNGTGEFRHDSTILYTNLMYMYYYSSCIVLCHHEVLQMVLQAASNGGSTIYENRYELNEASEGMAECLKELVRLKLVRWLPVSAVACAALPTILSILDIRFSAPTRDQVNESRPVGLKQHRLNVLVEAMKNYRPQGAGADWVSEIMRHVSNLTQPGDSSSRSRQISGWSKVRDMEPSSYLRLALALDVSLSKGSLPEDGDFPASLRGLLTDESSPLKTAWSDGSARRNKIGVDEVPGLDPALAATLGIDAPFNTSPVAEPNPYHSPTSRSPHSQSDSYLSNGDEARGPWITNERADENVLNSESLTGAVTDGGIVFDQDSSSPGSGFGGVHTDASADLSAQWGDTMWDGVDMMENREDWDRAKALLEALMEGDMAGIIV